MKALIVYDSFFGNTEKIARAVAAGMEPAVTVNVHQVAKVTADALQGINLLVVGSPTRGFQPTPAVKAFIRALPQQALKGIKVAAFDTGIAPEDADSKFLKLIIKIGGYASKPIANLLLKKGGTLAEPVQSFWVLGDKGPLKDKELERATVWGKTMAVSSSAS